MQRASAFSSATIRRARPANWIPSRPSGTSNGRPDSPLADLVDVANVATLVSLGNARAGEGRLDEAVGWYHAALLLNPEDALTVANLGRVLQGQGKLNKAAACYRRALELEPSKPWFHSYLGALLLLRGEFEEGWRECDWLWKIPEVQADSPAPDKPRWDGSPLEGRTCLLQALLGFGDNLQWVRYAPQVVARGGQVIVQCQPELVRLLHSLSGVEHVIAPGDPVPSFDVYAHPISLPYLLGVPYPQPTDVPYLHAGATDVERWARRLPPRAGLRVGLTWAPDPTHPGPWRSVPLAVLAPLANVPGITFFGLQKGPAVGQLSTAPAALRIPDVGRELTDFADTAALLTQLDLVITVDTAVAHLAGALGRPVWILLPTPPDARWLLDREDSPWYPSARLFRQHQPGDWAPVIARVAAALALITL